MAKRLPALHPGREILIVGKQRLGIRKSRAIQHAERKFRRQHVQLVGGSALVSHDSVFPAWFVAPCECAS